MTPEERKPNKQKNIMANLNQFFKEILELNFVSGGYQLSKHDRQIWLNYSNRFTGQQKLMPFDNLQSFDKNLAIHQHQPKFLQHGLVNLVAETYFNFPYPALSEKTFKSIFSKRAFLIAGPVGSLDTVHQLGFKTFDYLWDESYNKTVSPSQRLQKVIKIIQYLCQLGNKEFKELQEEIKNIADYNYQHYMNFHVHTITAEWY
jgi:hypothetical protein